MMTRLMLVFLLYLQLSSAFYLNTKRFRNNWRVPVRVVQNIYLQDPRIKFEMDEDDNASYENKPYDYKTDWAHIPRQFLRGMLI
ncbi:hypothetical protein GJ496_009096 [Pomphorhynchus laevis]|nr:hypothetical protein GJ496_009096 [Pomphorhynchus laevis]